MVRRILASLIILCLLPMALRADPDPDVTLSEADGLFPTFGVSLNNPDGWTRVPEESPENIARWAVMDAKTGHPQAILGVYVGRSGDGLIAYAQNQVRDNGGAISGEVQVNGERGILITADATASIITKHAGLFYIVTIRQAEGHHEKDFTTLADSIRWVSIDPPAKHLDLATPIPAFGGAITVQVPACMRPFAGENTPTALHLVATDIVNKREFSALLQATSLSDASTLEQARKNLLDGWNKKLQPSTPLEWKVDAKTPNVAVTNQIQVPTTANGQRGTATFQFGLVVDGEKSVLLTFTSRDAPDDELDALETAGGNIVASVKFTPQLQQRRRNLDQLSRPIGFSGGI